MTSTCPLAVSGFSPTPGVGPAGAEGATGASAGGCGATWVAAVPEASSRSTSALTIRPPGPDPESPLRSRPRSRATRLAIGEALMRPPSPAPTLPGEGGVALGAAGPGGGGGAAAPAGSWVPPGRGRTAAGAVEGPGAPPLPAGDASPATPPVPQTT